MALCMQNRIRAGAHDCTTYLTSFSEGNRTTSPEVDRGTETTLRGPIPRRGQAARQRKRAVGPR
ncbi:MAG: hypothetical protein KIT69_04050, partial [Propionibacteriaceae bacterium]|nr:hypothetical protein [Propionibacteriaceae bacterium]